MKLLASILISVGAAGALYAEQAGGQPPGQPSSAQKTGAISGIVRDSVTNRPISGAVVSLGPGSGRGGIATVQLTDERGRFVFAELPEYAGYTLDVRKAGYFTGHYGKTQAGASIALTSGQWIANANVALHRPAVISGTVTDEYGAPVAGAYVRLAREYPLAGRPHYAAGPVVQTDDRGTYRLSGLDPGRYIVITPSPQHAIPASTAVMMRMTNTSAQEAARLQAEGRPLGLGTPLLDIDSTAHLAVGRYPVPTPSPDGKLLSYRTLYFQDVASIEAATRVELRYGDERRGVDFRLQPAAGVRVSGVVEGPPDAIADITVRLMPAGMEDLGGFGTEAAASPIGDNNRFTFLNVPAGPYVIVARRTTSEIVLGGGPMSTLPSPPNQGNSFGSSRTLGAGLSPTPTDARLWTAGNRGSMEYGARLPITAGSEHVDGLIVSMQRGATLTARVVKEGNIPGSMNLSVDPADGSPSLLPGRFPTPVAQQAAELFTFEGLMPGQYFVRHQGMGVVKSVTWQGREHVDRPFDLSDGRDVADVVVTVTDQGATLGGFVRDRTGAPAAEAIVTVFPAERDQWIDYGMAPPRIKSTTTSTTGAYRIQGLPAGDYLVVAAMDIDPMSWREPGFMERVAPQASRVSIAWGDKPTHDVSLR